MRIVIAGASGFMGTRLRFGVPVPRWLVEPGAWAIRTETELVLKSRWVVPERLLGAGYAFRHPDVAPALAEIVARRRARGTARRGRELPGDAQPTPPLRG